MQHANMVGMYVNKAKRTRRCPYLEMPCDYPGSCFTCDRREWTPIQNYNDHNEDVAD